MDNFRYITKDDKVKDLFFKIPKALMYEEKYKNISANAKLLYGMLLDRTSLSLKNDWFDDKDRAYIICEISEVEIFLKCSRGTANKAMKELEKINLVKKLRLGNGYANLLYVAHVDTTKETLNTHLELHKRMVEELKKQRQEKEEERKAKKELEIEEVQKFKNCTSIENQKFKNCTSVENTDVQNEEVLEPLKTLRSTKIELQEVQNLNPNKTNTKDTEISMYVCSENPQTEKKDFITRFKDFLPISEVAAKRLPILELKIEYSLFDKILISTINDPTKINKENYIIGTLGKLVEKGIFTLEDYLEDVSVFTYNRYIKPKLKDDIFSDRTREEIINMNKTSEIIIDELLIGSVSIEELVKKSVESEDFFKALSLEKQVEVQNYIAINWYFKPYWINI